MAGAHGSSPAAWTAVAVFLVGFTVSSVGTVPDFNPVIFCIGIVVMVVAGIVGKIMSAAGMGSESAH
ncbi:HGxxPAAW family protein [Solicola gregarius]|uniref:Uncharacterized protein n=1 Tax=Solicola gregarius TaxID=2908642 RepID=A0AA46YK47_9ACTN|nr:HGxxPAAW family protein [Solicola gregarius]UYM05325.1 hypothetical protein L0C25_22905 [Solicola gregarius]